MKNQTKQTYGPRAMLKGPKKALLLLFLGLAGNHEQKMFSLEQKLCKGTKNVQEKIFFHKGFYGTLWY